MAPVTSTFEQEPYADSDIAGAMTANTYEVEVDSPHPHFAATILRADEDWGVHVELNMTGKLIVGPGALSEEFRMTVYLENLTPNEYDYEIPKPAFEVKTGLGGDLDAAGHWAGDIEIKSGKVDVGVYKPTVVAQLWNVGGNPWPVAAFVELPVIRIYQYP